MWLPLKNLHWSRACDKVFSLCLLNIGGTGIVTTAFASLSGDEIVRVDHEFGKKVAELKLALLQHLPITSLMHVDDVVFLNECGDLLADSDAWPQDLPSTRLDQFN